VTVAAILVAAGAGTRLGAGRPKAFCEVRGETLLSHAVRRFVLHPDVRDVIAVVPAALVGDVDTSDPSVRVVAGGLQRHDSVAAGLALLDEEVEYVLVHDAARPFVPAAVISRVVEALRSGAHAVVPAIPVTDTIKRVFEGVVVETIDRSALRAVQTPQGFAREVLLAAHRDIGPATDDASLVERLGIAITVVDGADESFKITTPWDLRIAEALT
jgi:2-C-methyl-D-erythritol 4-phosphate cytidylyltransferase